MSNGAASPPSAYATQVMQTRQALNAIDDATLVGLTRLGLKEVQALKQEVAEIFPASNLPAFLLQGLIQLDDRSLQPERIAADLKVLFRGTKQVGLFGTFLAAPAMVLYGYQRLLALAGKDIDSAFPDGPWQFYTEFGLREDAARHCVETVGFPQAMANLSETDAATCWIATALDTLFGYDDLLAQEWEERMLPRTLDAILTDAATTELQRSLPRKADARERAIADHVDQLRQHYHVDRLGADWAAQRPYGASPGSTLSAYLVFRRTRFRAYLEQTLAQLPPTLRADLDQRFSAQRTQALPAYQHQMTILMTLAAEPYQDRRVPFQLYAAHVALIVNGHYYLIPACARDAQGQLLIFPPEGAAERDAVALQLSETADGALQDRYHRPITITRRGRVLINGQRVGRLQPPTLATLKSQIDAILHHQGSERASIAPTDRLLAEAPRAEQASLRSHLPHETQAALAALRTAPIIVNWDRHTGTLPLTQIRRTQRGCGDHALTLIRTDRSMVFDLSHIFFDGSWGMALAEIMTQAAGNLLPIVCTTPLTAGRALPSLVLASSPSFDAVAHAAQATCPTEVAAETTAVDLRAMTQLRKRLSRIKLVLTINDLLLLARCLHAATYQPGMQAQQALGAIATLERGPALVQQIMAHLHEQQTINPAILIPMDASAADPRLRLFPATFRNPKPELIAHLQHCTTLVQQLQQQPTDTIRHQFEQERRALYTDLHTVAATLRALKQVTMRGESFTTAALRLLGHLPSGVQHLMDLIPQKIGILNEIIKGREVFSNVGVVAAQSTLTRFASARDDGDTKLLVWGIMTTAAGSLVITLRDFRPFVGPLVQMGRADLAQALAQDYLDAYAASANTLVQQLQRILSYQ